MRTSKFPFDPNAEYGDYVIDRGAVPGKPGEFYEVIDRAVAAREATKQSDANTSFVFFQKTQIPGGTKPVYRFESPSGQQSFQDFVSKPPSGAAGMPRRVGLF